MINALKILDTAMETKLSYLFSHVKIQFLMFCVWTLVLQMHVHEVGITIEIKLEEIQNQDHVKTGN